MAAARPTHTRKEFVQSKIALFVMDTEGGMTRGTYKRLRETTFDFLGFYDIGCRKVDAVVTYSQPMYSSWSADGCGTEPTTFSTFSLLSSVISEEEAARTSGPSTADKKVVDALYENIQTFLDRNRASHAIVMYWAKNEHDKTILSNHAEIPPYIVMVPALRTFEKFARIQRPSLSMEALRSELEHEVGRLSTAPHYACADVAYTRWAMEKLAWESLDNGLSPQENWNRALLLRKKNTQLYHFATYWIMGYSRSGNSILTTMVNFALSKGKSRNTKTSAKAEISIGENLYNREFPPNAMKGTTVPGFESPRLVIGFTGDHTKVHSLYDRVPDSDISRQSMLLSSRLGLLNTGHPNVDREFNSYCLLAMRPTTGSYLDMVQSTCGFTERDGYLPGDRICKLDLLDLLSRDIGGLTISRPSEAESRSALTRDQLFASLSKRLGTVTVALHAVRFDLEGTPHGSVPVSPIIGRRRGVRLEGGAGGGAGSGSYDWALDGLEERHPEWSKTDRTSSEPDAHRREHREAAEDGRESEAARPAGSDPVPPDDPLHLQDGVSTRTYEEQGHDDTPHARKNDAEDEDVDRETDFLVFQQSPSHQIHVIGCRHVSKIDRKKFAVQNAAYLRANGDKVCKICAKRIGLSG